MPLDEVTRVEPFDASDLCVAQRDFIVWAILFHFNQ
jgi:hypothetical protein